MQTFNLVGGGFVMVRLELKAVHLAKKYYLFIFVVVLLILCVNQFLVYADSPITSTCFYVAYKDIPEVKKIVEQPVLDEELAAFLLDNDTPLDKAAAVINALSWITDGQNNSQYLIDYLTNQDRTFSERLESLDVSGRVLFVLGYLKAMDNYFEVIQAAQWLTYAKKKIPDSFTVPVIYALVEAQIHLHIPGEWCEVWKAIKESLDAFPENRDMREAAIRKILNYMEPYKGYCCDDVQNGCGVEFG